IWWDRPSCLSSVAVLGEGRSGDFVRRSTAERDRQECLSHRIWLVNLTVFICTAWGMAQPATMPATLEPGQAEARDGAGERPPLPKEWSHPKYEFRGVWISTREMLLPREQLAAKLDALR